MDMSKGKDIVIREYRQEDTAEIYSLFLDTVKSVCSKDYSKEEISAWASGDADLKEWEASFLSRNTFVAEKNGKIVGFGDGTNEGYIDRLYVQKAFLGLGIGKKIVDKLERKATDCEVKEFFVYASITARAFFEKLGYIVIRENIVERKGVKLKNYYMRKRVLG